MRARAYRPILLTGVLLMAAAGCSPKQAPAKADFRATDTAGRVPAIVHAAEDDDQAALPELIRALSDDDPAVRLFAIQSLQKRTGQAHGYRYYDSADKRQAAVTRWHEWLSESSAPLSATTAADTASP